MLLEVQKLLRDRRIDLVAAATGLSRSTITNIRDGLNNNPTHATLQKLHEYLKATSVKGQ
jgi:transcriptional regulator with XRE-family HTH domain